MSDLNQRIFEREWLGKTLGIEFQELTPTRVVATMPITPAHHQLLLAIRGHHGPEGPTITDVAESLLLRHHSAVGLVDRAVMAGIVERNADPGDHRVVRLRLTARGARRVRQLSRLHLEELRRLAPRMRSLWADLDASTTAPDG